jgi:hypothetical protein
MAGVLWDEKLLAALGRLYSPPVLSGVRVAHLFSFLCCVFCFCLSSSCVLSTQCCQFLWILHIWLHFRFSLTFICNIDCLLYVPSIYRRRPSWILCWNMGRVVTAEETMVTDKVCRAGQERAIVILFYNDALTIMMYNWLIVISTIGLWHCGVCNFQNYDLY